MRSSKCLHLLFTLLFTSLLGNVLSLSVVYLYLFNSFPSRHPIHPFCICSSETSHTSYIDAQLKDLFNKETTHSRVMFMIVLLLSQEDGLKGFFSQSKLTGENQVYCDECEAKADTTTVSNSITDWMYHHLNTEVLTRLRPFLYSLLPLGIWSRTTSRGSCAAAQKIWVQLQRNGLR